MRAEFNSVLLRKHIFEVYLISNPNPDPDRRPPGKFLDRLRNLSEGRCSDETIDHSVEAGTGREHHLLLDVALYVVLYVASSMFFLLR